MTNAKRGFSCFAFAFWDTRVIVQQEAYILVQFNTMTKGRGGEGSGFCESCHFDKKRQKKVLTKGGRSDILREASRGNPVGKQLKKFFKKL